MKHKLSIAVLCAVLLALLVVFAVSCNNAGSTTTDDSTVSSEQPGTDSNSDSADISDTSTAGPDDTDPPASDTLTPPDTSNPPETEPEPPQQEDMSAIQRVCYEFSDSVNAAAQQGKVVDRTEAVSKIEDNWSKIYRDITNEMLKYYTRFINGQISFDYFKCTMNSFAKIANAKGLSEGYIKVAEAKREDVDHYQNAQSYVTSGKFMKAAMSLSKISRNDSTTVDNAKALISANVQKFKDGITEAVTEYMVRYDIAEGQNFLIGLQGLGLDSHITSEAQRLEEYRKFQDVDLEKVNVTTTLENIYTHCLIAFPEINFASMSTYRKCGDDCLTPNEFRYLLGRLYELDYIIVDANLFYDAENDTFNRYLNLPKGKKPLIFTFDDVTYDSRKMGNGMVDKLIVDEDGYVCTYTKHKNGSVVVSYDNELFPIINSFVREHPDFTFRGARGTLFFTGFDGICGYRTQSEPVDNAEAALKLDRQSEIAQAKVVIEALRDEGWTFGSHSYHHWHLPRQSSAAIRRDTNMWLEEVGAIVGETTLYCWPFGDHTNDDKNIRKNEDHKFLFDSGFKFFFGCGSARYISNELDGLGIFSDRKGVTGNVLYYIEMEYKSYLRDYLYLIDPDKMWDEYRLPYKYKPPYKAY